MNDFLNNLKIFYEISLKCLSHKSNERLFKKSLITTDDLGNFYLINSIYEFFEFSNDKTTNLNIKQLRFIINKYLDICPDYSNIIIKLTYEIIISCKYRSLARIELIQNYFYIINKIKEIIFSKSFDISKIDSLDIIVKSVIHKYPDYIKTMTNDFFTDNINTEYEYKYLYFKNVEQKIINTNKTLFKVKLKEYKNLKENFIFYDEESLICEEYQINIKLSYKDIQNFILFLVEKEISNLFILNDAVSDIKKFSRIFDDYNINLLFFYEKEDIKFNSINIYSYKFIEFEILKISDYNVEINNYTSYDNKNNYYISFSNIPSKYVIIFSTCLIQARTIERIIKRILKLYRICSNYNNKFTTVDNLIDSISQFIEFEKFNIPYLCDILRNLILPYSINKIKNELNHLEDIGKISISIEYLLYILKTFIYIN